jgi:hypothetical protein
VDVDPGADPGYQNDADPDPQHCLLLSCVQQDCEHLPDKHTHQHHPGPGHFSSVLHYKVREFDKFSLDLSTFCSTCWSVELFIY